MATQLIRRRDARHVLADVESDLGASADPLEYLLRVMADPNESPAARREAAKEALPYIHARKGAEGDAADGAPQAALAELWGRLRANPAIWSALAQAALATATAPALPSGDTLSLDIGPDDES